MASDRRERIPVRTYVRLRIGVYTLARGAYVNNWDKARFTGAACVRMHGGSRDKGIFMFKENASDDSLAELCVLFIYTLKKAVSVCYMRDKCQIRDIYLFRRV